MSMVKALAVFVAVLLACFTLTSSQIQPGTSQMEYEAPEISEQGQGTGQGAAQYSPSGQTPIEFEAQELPSQEQGQVATQTRGQAISGTTGSGSNNRIAEQEFESPEGPATHNGALDTTAARGNEHQTGPGATQNSNYEYELPENPNAQQSNNQQTAKGGQYSQSKKSTGSQNNQQTVNGKEYNTVKLAQAGQQSLQEQVTTNKQTNPSDPTYLRGKLPVQFYNYDINNVRAAQRNRAVAIAKKESAPAYDQTDVSQVGGSATGSQTAGNQAVGNKATGPAAGEQASGATSLYKTPTNSGTTSGIAGSSHAVAVPSNNHATVDQTTANVQADSNQVAAATLYDQTARGVDQSVRTPVNQPSGIAPKESTTVKKAKGTGASASTLHSQTSEQTINIKSPILDAPGTAMNVKSGTTRKTSSQSTTVADTTLQSNTGGAPGYQQRPPLTVDYLKAYVLRALRLKFRELMRRRTKLYRL